MIKYFWRTKCFLYEIFFQQTWTVWWTYRVVSAGGQRMKYGAMWTPGVSITKASEEMPGMELPISLKARTLNLYMMPVHAAVHAVHDAEPVHDAAQDVV